VGRVAFEREREKERESVCVFCVFYCEKRKWFEDERPKEKIDRYLFDETANQKTFTLVCSTES
jgi:uncharacterized protein YkuJ